VLSDQMKKSFGWVVVAVLLVSTFGCSYNGHTNMGTTEKWVAADIHPIPKTLVLIPIALLDSVFSPFTAAGDQIFRGEQYHEDHKYLSYSGSRAIGRSGMPLGYQIITNIFAIPIETIFLPLTGLVDLITVMVSGDESTEVDHEED
jgi:hypothetical protein